MRTRVWLAAGCFALGVALACGSSRRSGFCGAYADDVAACCPLEDYYDLRAVCQLDIDQAGSNGGGCRRAMVDLYDCIGEVACSDGCPGGGPGDCVQQQSAVLGLCTAPPPDPTIPR